ncbi:Rrf2 family transcriptional regulator [Maribacter sp. MMG018]|uniref:RrF2 family transcriptional regulator n=1 Tax=Maribacter sp. MMG018 TaxID=2822688 RepID=UPI001B37DCC6|nr:Rrf2 family transcriptional regulator [Maribacter sp. MMG018]MBQ4913243.1 Rrf2 family transcriptional regulator [Maribacter sp. MMG018]
MISNSAKYALIAVLYLAANSSEENKILAKDLSEQTGVPKAYLSKLMQELTRENLISSTRGPNGGFYMTKEECNRFLIDIITAIDGGYRLETCVLSLHKCDAKHPCPLHNLFSDSKNDFVKRLKETRIQDLVQDIKLGNSFLSI